MSKSDSPTTLSNSQYEECLKVAIQYLQTNPCIRNKGLRAATAIGYDQAIYFFNRAIAEGILVRKGAGSGTHYVLAREE
jgi:hypothetical protein